MKQSSERPYSHPNQIIGAFFTIDPKKCDNKLKKIYEQNLTKKIHEIIFENNLMTILWTFAIIQAFTAP
jgi:hypothetical protein